MRWCGAGAQTVRDKILLVSNYVVSGYMSDPAAARGQAIMALGQTIEQQPLIAANGDMLAAIGIMLIAVAWLALLARRHRTPSAARTATPRLTRSRIGEMFGGALTYAILSCAAALAFALAASSASATPAASPLGTWSTANGHGVVAIEPCGSALCGRIVGIDRAPGESMPTDVDGRPQCGLTIITNEKPETAGSWLGEVTDPRDGGTYRAKLWVDEQGNLRLRGFIGIPALGATQVWHRFTGHLTTACRFA
jgi:uncharacterized protein (DUF2147 family)